MFTLLLYHMCTLTAIEYLLYRLSSTKTVDERKQKRIPIDILIFIK